MGASWRVGVNTDERTTLVTGGLFAHARNPVFTAMAITALGLALMVPNWVSLLALACLITAIQLQVRVVEEPYLKAMHGPAYRPTPPAPDASSPEAAASPPNRTDATNRPRARQCPGRARSISAALSVPQRPPGARAHPDGADQPEAAAALSACRSSSSPGAPARPSGVR
ncbi:methyltransferase [Streptomyces coelicoflavus]|nr:MULTISPECIES: isoprenylcysteine carboxylmethyltransferase family protein [unclassified Streptomyces]MCT7350596.1 hypothetical protein [Streptomyces sp. 15-116A]MCW1097656.1 hypothetical protein [Streptomyces sp. RS2]WDI23160.1 methyltransferase [Streptomyces enissocaesilis]